MLIQKTMYAVFKKPTQDEIESGTRVDLPYSGRINALEVRCWEGLEFDYGMTRENLERDGYYTKPVTVSWESD